MTKFRTTVNELIKINISIADLKRIRLSLSLQDYIGRFSELEMKKQTLLKGLHELQESSPKQYIHIPGVNDMEYAHYLKSLIK